MASNRRMFTLRIEEDLYKKVQLIAFLQNRSMSNYIEYLLQTEVTEYEKAHGSLDTIGAALNEIKGMLPKDDY